ncbi:MAG: hypothetical protein ACE5NG_10080 [bacterium]
MQPNLYEILWDVETDVCSFLYREFKVFNSHAEAKKFGIERETYFNEGKSMDEIAQDGYYFKYHSACEVNEIDGYVVNLF